LYDYALAAYPRARSINQSIERFAGGPAATLVLFRCPHDRGATSVACTTPPDAARHFTITIELMSPREKNVVAPAPQPARRIPWGTLSRSQIVEAALGIVQRGEYEQMTIRSLAAELGASPMSLYRHVRGKGDLLDEVVDVLLAESWKPRASHRDWKRFVAEAADRLRKLLVSEPAALQVYLSHPVISPAAMERMDAMMESLRGSGLSEREARRAYGAIQTYTVGFAALEAGRAGWRAPGDDVNDTAHYLGTFTSPQQFTEGLRYLLTAIEQGAP
jgi:AcrR family transcriptional regulator